MNSYEQISATVLFITPDSVDLILEEYALPDYANWKVTKAGAPYGSISAQQAMKEFKTDQRITFIRPDRKWACQ